MWPLIPGPGVVGLYGLFEGDFFPVEEAPPSRSRGLLLLGSRKKAWRPRRLHMIGADSMLDVVHALPAWTQLGSDEQAAIDGFLAQSGGDPDQIRAMGDLPVDAQLDMLKQAAAVAAMMQGGDPSQGFDPTQMQVDPSQGFDPSQMASQGFDPSQGYDPQQQQSYDPSQYGGAPPAPDSSGGGAPTDAQLNQAQQQADTEATGAMQWLLSSAASQWSKLLGANMPAAAAAKVASARAAGQRAIDIGQRAIKAGNKRGAAVVAAGKRAVDASNKLAAATQQKAQQKTPLPRQTSPQQRAPLPRMQQPRLRLRGIGIRLLGADRSVW